MHGEEAGNKWGKPDMRFAYWRQDAADIATVTLLADTPTSGLMLLSRTILRAEGNVFMASGAARLDFHDRRVAKVMEVIKSNLSTHVSRRVAAQIANLEPAYFSKRSIESLAIRSRLGTQRSAWRGPKCSW